MFTLFKNVKISISGKHHPRRGRGAKSLLVLFSKVNIFHTKRCPHLVSELLTRGGGGHTSISLTGMLVREQSSTTEKNRMTLNSNPKK